jgi:hypothetical protein
MVICFMTDASERTWKETVLDEPNSISKFCFNGVRKVAKDHKHNGSYRSEDSRLAHLEYRSGALLARQTTDNVLYDHT